MEGRDGSSPYKSDAGTFSLPGAPPAKMFNGRYLRIADRARDFRGYGISLLIGHTDRCPTLPKGNSTHALACRILRRGDTMNRAALMINNLLWKGVACLRGPWKIPAPLNSVP